MKRFLSMILSAVMGVCFVGCDKLKNQDQGQEIAATYYGVVQTLDGNEGLFVYIPEVGVCDLPSSDITIKEGDLLRMDFDGAEVEFMETHPVKIKTPVKNMTVAMENVELEQDKNEYVLTIDYTQDFKDDVLAREKYVGDTVYFLSSRGLPGTNDVPSVEMIFVYCRATLESTIGSARLSLRLHLEEPCSIKDFLQGFATRRIRFSGEFETNNEPLISFFDVRTKLQAEDIIKVETIVYPGSVSPDHRDPIEYKPTTQVNDIQTIYRWLRGLFSSSLLTQVTENEALIEGGTSTCMTVYTEFGAFKIWENARCLRIWDRFFLKGYNEMPYFYGDSTTYAFESYCNATELYIDGEKKGDYEFELDKLVCKETGGNFARQQEYKLVTDIGELIVYDAMHFERFNVTYEIIGGGNFSKILEDYPLRTDKLDLLKAAYEVGKAEWVTASVVDYYGEFASGALVAMMTANDEAYNDACWVVEVAGYEFQYNSGNRITVFYNESFCSLGAAYKNGYLTAEEIGVIYKMHRKFYPFSYEEHRIDLPSYPNMFAVAYEYCYPKAGNATVTFLYGGLTDKLVMVGMVAGDMQDFYAEEWTETVAECDFNYESSCRLLVYDGCYAFYTLTQAYELELLKAEEIADIAEKWRVFCERE